ncbi:MAG TPA: 4-hydroxythreonine-4-phosphate dehydrogenase PdxA [bacterium (Candidatus Stahlbacteria)]|nr:4-hydroxythreonine-4-phosphate dehydrogenase PdxA [Candidatus Stahlbacteria bacterium]
MNPRIGITMGDPSGIGPEVTLKAISTLKNINIVLIGSKAIFDEAKQRFNIHSVPEIINCVTIKREEVPYGRTSKKGGVASYKSILGALDLIKRGKIDAIVTAPISKAALNLAGIHYPGHTELLAAFTQTEHFAMMLASDNLRITLVTTHVPLRDVPSKLTIDGILDKIELTHSFLIKFFHVKKPKIGICALNPHAGEEGILGQEEGDKISPAILKAKEKGINAFGPYPSDTLFTKNGFDAIIAMYHDQGLIPIKLRSFGKAVNITLGLPFVRTSPDHGTAFDIAGKGIADPSSMIEAIKMAQRLVISDW